MIKKTPGSQPDSRGYVTSTGQILIPRAQGFDATNAQFYEVSLGDPDHLEVFCYTDRLSYVPDDVVEVHVSTTAREFSIEVIRDGMNPVSVHEASGLPGQSHTVPPRFYEDGCGWPVAYRWRIPSDLPTGFYVVRCTVRSSSGTPTMPADALSQPTVRVQEHGVFVRRRADQPRADILLVAATCTWNAYNDWGGFSHYTGHDLPDGLRHAPRLSIHRPFARGFIWVPEGAPRKPHRLPHATNAIPTYPIIEFAYTRGYSKWYGNAGWATYERPFVVFAEQEGYRLDYATQSDLHYDSSLLDGYKCVVFVGHCEYWSRQMRQTVDAYVKHGGHVARFAGDFSYQTRLEEDGRVQVAYKERAHDCDPVRNTSERHLLTAHWDDPAVDWFGAETFGLNNQYGIYAHVGVNNPRGTGGFTLYRPDHWAFAGTDLYYGDDFGGDAKIFGYEVDGLDYTFEDGLPQPTFKDRAPPGTQILAMAIASNLEEDHGHRGSVFYYGDGSAEMAQRRYGADTPELRARAARANGMIVTFRSGKGEVFHAGSCEWVAGLKYNDFCTQTITRNILDRYTGNTRLR